MREFAESEVIIPDGPYQGRKYRCSRQPYSACYFAEVDSGRWSRIFATGPTQSGKTLTCSVIPVLYHLFEVAETVIFGVPSGEMASDKWKVDLLPVIQSSPALREMLPTKGPGSKGGSKLDSIRFRNGATLKFLTAFGGDKTVSGYTSRVLAVTEVDGMDKSGESSREADRFTQMEARTRADVARSRVYGECTVSIDTGRTWIEYTQGTESKILRPCPHCGEYVAPEREHLKGWQNAQSKIEARELARFHCPACDVPWTDEERAGANRQSVLAHRGQVVDADGNVSGELPETDTLGFRWSAVDNMFTTGGYVGAGEWVASRSADEDNAEKEQRQFVWAIPVDSSIENEMNISISKVQTRVLACARGIVPEGRECLTLGIDIGKWQCHWVAVAWNGNAAGHVVDYATFEVRSQSQSVELALLLAFREFRDVVLKGWPIGSPGGEKLEAEAVLLDSGWAESQEAVYEFCLESDMPFMPMKGYGMSQTMLKHYHRPKTTGAEVTILGDEYHVARQPSGVELFHINADYWKTWIHQRLVCKPDDPSALTLFNAMPRDHLGFAKHVTAEKGVEEYVAGKGVKKVWTRLRRDNHWFDALYMAAAAAHACGVRVLAGESVDPPEQTGGAVIHPGDSRPDGRGWLEG